LILIHIAYACDDGSLIWICGLLLWTLENLTFVVYDLAYLGSNIAETFAFVCHAYFVGSPFVLLRNYHQMVYFYQVAPLATVGTIQNDSPMEGDETFPIIIALSYPLPILIISEGNIFTAPMWKA
jgi:hypothetical protein